MIKYYFVLVSLIYYFYLTQHTHDTYIVLVLFHIMFIIFFIGIDIAYTCSKINEYLNGK